MFSSRLWISFHHQDDHVDHWAIYLEAGYKADCDIWQASGQTFEFEYTHIRGINPEDVLNFKEKWLLKSDLTESDAIEIRDIARKQPVDNEGAYWDCRIFCFELLASLESQGILDRSDDKYRLVRKRLHEKWKFDDGVSAEDSDEYDEYDDADNQTPDLNRVGDSDLEDESSEGDESTPGTEEASAEIYTVDKKSALSQDSDAKFKSLTVFAEDLRGPEVDK